MQIDLTKTQIEEKLHADSTNMWHNVDPHMRFDKTEVKECFLKYLELMKSDGLLIRALLEWSETHECSDGCIKEVCAGMKEAIIKAYDELCNDIYQAMTESRNELGW